MHRAMGQPSIFEAFLPESLGQNRKLERTEEAVDWGPFEKLVAKIYSAPEGRPSYPPLLMVKVLLLEQWYGLSDPQMAEGLGDRISFRRFVGLGLQEETPYYSTISRFHTALAEPPGVGRNMRDHPNVSVRFSGKEGPPEDPDAMRAVRLRYTASGSSTPHDMIISPASLNTVVRTGDNPTHTVGCGLYLAAGQGELRLVSADPHTPPSMDYRYLEEDWDRERLRESVRLCVSLLQHSAYVGIIEEVPAPTPSDLESDEALDSWLRRNISTSYHISGTCKMGPANDPMAVVDRQLRVRGVSGLRVADASIMPDVVRANTNVTTMMIAERVADFINAGN